MSKRTLFLIFALLVITFVLAMIAFYDPNSLNSKPVRPTVATPKQPVAETVLSFGDLSIAATSSAQSLTKTYSVPINIESGTNKVTAIQLELQYDPLLLTSISLTPGQFFKNPNLLLNQVDEKTGRISYAFGIGLGEMEEGVQGIGIAATLTFRVKKEPFEQTAILFLPKTLVTSENMAGSSLKRTDNGLFTIRETTD